MGGGGRRRHTQDTLLRCCVCALWRSLWYGQWRTATVWCCVRCCVVQVHACTHDARYHAWVRQFTARVSVYTTLPQGVSVHQTAAG